MYNIYTFGFRWLLFDDLRLVIVVIDETDEESRCHEWACISVNHQQILPLLYLQRSELVSLDIEKESMKWLFLILVSILYQPLANTIRYLSFSTCLDLVKWDQFSWLPGISWPIAWQRLLLVSAYNEAFAVKHITCAGRHVESRSWRSSKLHGWHLNSAHAISLKDRSLNVYMYIYVFYQNCTI